MTTNAKVALARPVERSTDEIVRERLVMRRDEMMRYFRRRLRSREDAEDALQDASLKAIRSAMNLRSPERADAWLGSVMRSTLVDRYRLSSARRRAEEAFARDPVAGEATDKDPEPHCHCVFAALSALRPDQAKLIRCVDLDERPRNEVANDLGVNVNALGVRLHRARVALKGAISDICPTCARGEFAVCDCARSEARQPGLAA